MSKTTTEGYFLGEAQTQGTESHVPKSYTSHCFSQQNSRNKFHHNKPQPSSSYYNVKDSTRATNTSHLSWGDASTCLHVQCFDSDNKHQLGFSDSQELSHWVSQTSSVSFPLSQQSLLTEQQAVLNGKVQDLLHKEAMEPILNKDGFFSPSSRHPILNLKDWSVSCDLTFKRESHYESQGKKNDHLFKINLHQVCHYIPYTGNSSDSWCLVPIQGASLWFINWQGLQPHRQQSIWAPPKQTYWKIAGWSISSTFNACIVSTLHDLGLWHSGWVFERYNAALPRHGIGDSTGIHPRIARELESLASLWSLCGLNFKYLRVNSDPNGFLMK